MDSGYLQFILAAIISCITAIITTLRARHKEKTNQFSAFMEESTSFRKELVEDRRQIKEQLDFVVIECDKCKAVVQVLETDKKTLSSKVKQLEDDLVDANFRIDQLTEKLRRMKEVQLIVKDMDA